MKRSLSISPSLSLPFSFSTEMFSIHAFSDWPNGISHSSSQEVEEGIQRNWLELPADVLSLIFLKLGVVHILASAQCVCTSWWKLSKQPHLFRSIHVENFRNVHFLNVEFYSYKFSEGLTKEAIDRSCGQAVEFVVQCMATDEILHYMSERSSSLRCLRLISCYEVSNNGLIEMAKKLPQLEELDIHCCSYSSTYVIETFGCFCPRLKSCRLNRVNYLTTNKFDGFAVAIAQNMPELRHLGLYGNTLKDGDLSVVLDGCPHLESLDLRKCFDLTFAGNLKERCGSIKVLRLPNDSVDDFEFEQRPCPIYKCSSRYANFFDDDTYSELNFLDEENYESDSYDCNT